LPEEEEMVWRDSISTGSDAVEEKKARVVMTAVRVRRTIVPA
jgi:hypothetical protein